MKYITGVLLGALIIFATPLYFLCVYMQPFFSLIHVLMLYVPKISPEIPVEKQKVNIFDQNNNNTPISKEKLNSTKQDAKASKTITPPEAATKQLSLHNLAHGFQTYAHKKKQLVPQESSLEISEIRFVEKLMQAVLTQLKINRENITRYASQSYSLHCAISLERNGFIKNIAISKTSTNIFLDSLIKTIIQDSSGSFPPIPLSIKRIPYMIIFDIKIGHFISLQVLLPK